MGPMPPHTKENLRALDRWHQRAGQYEEWMLSPERAAITGPKHVVRILNWSNLREVCRNAGMDEEKLVEAYRHAVQTNDVIFVEYDLE